ncbi:hypothetical protein AGMMS4956_20830 [Bacteroidia bacterium]|nr:hypothetical protein AGMMS4956_20830 [Bacteroidia bacterium]
MENIQTLDLEAINCNFNAELQQQIDGTLPKGHVYSLGMPGNILQAVGMPYLPIELRAEKLLEKSVDEEHPYNIKEITNLPKAIQNPLAVFAYGDRTKAINLIIEIQHNEKNFLIGIALNPTVKGKSLEVNSIRNVFPKDTHEWVNWINQNKGLYYDKEKILTLLDQQRINHADVAFVLPNIGRVKQEDLESRYFACSPTSINCIIWASGKQCQKARLHGLMNIVRTAFIKT